jgi:thioredoxin
MEKADPELETIRLKKANEMINKTGMPSSIVKLHTYQDYEKILADYPEKVILIDFTAVWCGPCKFYGPIFEKVQKEYSNDFIFAKVDVDENRQVAMQHQITGVPTTLFIKNGKVIQQAVGALNYDMLKNYLESFKS